MRQIEEDSRKRSRKTSIFCFVKENKNKRDICEEDDKGAGKRQEKRIST